MATIVTRAGKGAALTHQEVDANFTGLNTELGQKEVASNKGVANGYASLDAAGKVPSAQLPSYVDDVVEVANFASLPGTGETGKIYVTIDANKTYRWTGSTYIEISASPGSTDSLAEGSTNLYFTQARARSSVSASGSLSYNSSTGVMSFTDAVTSVAGRSGAVTLTSSDVGLGNVENKSSATIRGEITSGNVTTALGYTPYNSTNPSGYITSSALSSYLPLSGGTLTGALSAPNFRDGSGAFNVNLGSSSEGRGAVAGFSGGAYGGIGFNVRHTSTSEQYVAPSGDTVSYLRFDGGGFRFYGSAVGAAGRTVTFTGAGNAFLDPSGNWYTAGQMYATGSQHLVLNTGNVGSYALPITGGTLTGDLQISSSWGGSPVGYNEALTIYGTYPSMTYRSTTTGSVWLHHMQSDGAMTYYYASDAATSSNWAMKARMGIDGQLYFGSGTAVPYLHVSNVGTYALPIGGGTLTGSRPIQLSTGDGALFITGNSGGWSMGTYFKGSGGTIRAGFGALGSGNDFSYAWIGTGYENAWLTLNGSAVSSTVGLNVGAAIGTRGTSLSVSGSSNSSAIAAKSGDHATVFSVLPHSQSYTYLGTGVYYDDGAWVHASADTTNALFAFSGAAGGSWYASNNSSGSWNVASAQILWNTSGTWVGLLNATSGAQVAGNTILHLGNYSSYALPLSGGTLTGSATISGNGYGLYFTGGNNRIYFSGYRAMEGSTNGVQLQIGENYSGTYLQSANNYATASNHLILHAGNYTSYSPSLTGSGASGTWGINITGNASTVSSLNGAITILSGGGGATFGANHYSMGKDIANGSWSHPHYSDLIIGYHTGIRLGAAYSGIRFYANSPTTDANNDGNGDQGEALLMTVGGYALGGSVNIVNDCYAYGYRGHSNVAGTGQASYHPAGIYSVGTNWLYGTINMNGNSIQDCSRMNGPWTSSARCYSNEWIELPNHTGLFSSLNGAHFYPNNTEYGSWRIAGSRAGWHGIYFDSGANLMMNSNEVGFHRAGYGWQMWWSAGTGYVHKGNPGGGTQATILDSSNYTSYSPSLTGSGASGSWSITAARATRANGNFYIDDNYGCGIVGAYASTRYQGVFAMGDSYKLPADGTSAGNLYGIAWSYPSAGGVAGNLDSHGMLVLINGGFGSCMSYSIKASGNVTAYSDERLKTNWRPMPESFVERLAAVRVGIYDRTDGEQITQVGVSAQSLQAVLPEAITTAADEMGTLSVSYGNAAMASAVELAKELVALKHKVTELEARIH